MSNEHVTKIASELMLKPQQVVATAELLEGGATVPFIARYRKEVTGSLDEVAVAAIRDRLGQLKELDDRRESIIKSLEERELLTDELQEQIMQAETMAVLEDIYLPYRPKRRTRATIAKEKGLEPLAEVIFAQDAAVEPAAEAEAFVDEEQGVESVEDALAGARDIIAEWVSEDQTARAEMRRLFSSKGLFQTKVLKDKEEEGRKYE
ncbi:MAG: Tex-like N-terminal domain-containing protein, partial [Planctomycetota bacterium]